MSVIRSFIFFNIKYEYNITLNNRYHHKACSAQQKQGGTICFNNT